MNPLRDYIVNDKDTIEGWFSRMDSHIFFEILTLQNNEEIAGGVAEIGLHHGKSFIALCLGLKPGEKAYGIDVFDTQSLNVDWSGKGSRVIIERNLRRFGVLESSVVLDGRSSGAVTRSDIVNAVGEVRFFSIDGGHWRGIVRSDLTLAESVLAKEGVIALDDFLRPEWPDVSLGFFDWYESSSKNLIPVAIGYNKLYLCHTNSAERFRRCIEYSSFLRHFQQKRYDFLGNSIPVFSAFPQAEWPLRRRLSHYLQVYRPDLYVVFRRLRKRLSHSS